MDVADGGPRQPNGLGHPLQVTRHQHHVGRLDGHVGTGADGHSHLGLRQRRRIVDAVAHIGQRTVGGLQALHCLHLARRQHLSHHLVDAQFPGNGLRGPGVVARDHRHLQPLRMQRRNGRRRRRLDRIRHRHDGGQLAVRGHIERRLALAPQALRHLGKGAHIHPQRLHVAVGPHGHRHPSRFRRVSAHFRRILHPCVHAQPRQRLEVLHRR